MKTQLLKIAGAAALVSGLAACATGTPYGYQVSQPTYSQPTYSQPGYSQPGYSSQVGAVEFGRISNVQLVSQGSTANPNNGTAGTLIGGVLGGVLGNQVGHGGGRAAATILGAVGGAAVGNRIANNQAGAYNSTGPVYRVWVQMDSGVTRTYDVSALGDLHPGDRVRVENGAIYLS